jgi:hypothetical protein
MSSPLIERAEQHEYQKLFLHDLNWSRPESPRVCQTVSSAGSGCSTALI